MVEIYLNVDGSHHSFLSIPLDDFRRLSIRPFKWLRYVLYCICGARGDLSASQGAPPVDYNSTELLADDVKYFYEPSGRFFLHVRSFPTTRFSRALYLRGLRRFK
jgi:hypothetical protein